MNTKIRIRCQLGDLIVELDEANAPKTCANFIAYMEAGAYDNSSFFRIVTPEHNPDDPESQIAVVQGGTKLDPNGYTPKLDRFHLDHEPTNETGISHDNGTISMGRFAPGQTYGGFFFCIGKQPSLDHGGSRFSDRLGTAAFGQIVEGLDVLYQLYQKAEKSELLKTEIPIYSVTVV